MRRSCSGLLAFQATRDISGGGWMFHGRDAALSVALDTTSEPSTSRPAVPFTTRVFHSSIKPQSSRWWSRKGPVSTRGLAARASEKTQTSSNNDGARPPSVSDVVGSAPYPGESHPCWSCQSAQGPEFSFFCSTCGLIQPKRPDADHYAVMGLSRRDFDVDLTDLEAKYKNLQRLLHPDKFTTRSAEEQSYSADQASAVNVSYHTLRDPLRRGNYLLNGTGIGCGEGFEGTITDPELLMEVMERREEIENTSDPGALTKLRESLGREKEEVIRQLSSAFRARNLEEAGEVLVRLRYLQRMDEQILDKL